MLKKIKSLVIISILLMSILYTFINPNLIFKDIIEALNIFVNNLFPAMFFFYTISDLLINYDFIKVLEKLLNKPFERIFHIGGTSSFIVIMSLLSGFPSGSKYITTFLEQKRITKSQANYLLTFTHFSNPLFIMGTISMLYTKRLAIIILISHYLANFILAFLLRPKKIEQEYAPANFEKLSFSDTLANSFTKSFKILLLVLGNTIFFYTLSDIVTNFIHDDLIKTLIYGFFDLTKGTLFVNTLNITPFFKCILLVSFLSFGGISVHFQVKEIIKKERINYFYFLLGRIISLALSLVILIGLFAVRII